MPTVRRIPTVTQLKSVPHDSLRALRKPNKGHEAWLAAGTEGIVPAATMFQPHSILWHYLWAGSNVVLLLLAVVIYRRSLHRQFPIFLTFVVVQGVAGLALYLMSLAYWHFKLTRASPELWWKANFVDLLIEVVLKFALIGEILSQLLKLFPALSKLGKVMVRVAGPVLVLAATGVVALSRPSEFAPIIANSHRLDLADYVIQCGMLLCIFLFAAYFHLAWGRLSVGIAVGLGLAGSVQLGTWALWSNLPVTFHQRTLLDFLNMGVYHLSVLIWLYYVLTTPKATLMDKLGEKDDHHDDRGPSGRDVSGGGPRGRDSGEAALNGEDERQYDLVVWNRELERLLKR
jgi:hypothetical protein